MIHVGVSSKALRTRAAMNALPMLVEESSACPQYQSCLLVDLRDAKAKAYKDDREYARRRSAETNTTSNILEVSDAESSTASSFSRKKSLDCVPIESGGILRQKTFSRYWRTEEQTPGQANVDGGWKRNELSGTSLKGLEPFSEVASDDDDFEAKQNTLSEPTRASTTTCKERWIRY